MSKIHKALERAEKERTKEFQKSHFFDSEIEGEEKKKEIELTSVLDKVEGIITDQKLVPLFQNDSLAAEQFRKLRTYLLRIKISNPPRTILVTSATSGEGKTLIAANLAASIAHDLRSHALLVDCDLRNSSLGHWFGLQNSRGLSDYLAGNGGISELVVKTEVEKLTLLPSGSAPSNPNELIGSKKMEVLIQEFKSKYEDGYLILDSTPLLMTAEPEVLSKIVDGILIVVRAGVTPRETVKQALSSIDKGKILGFVLNDLQFKSSGLTSRYFGSNGYYYKYGYGYGYGKSKEKPQKKWAKLFGWIHKPS